MLREFSADFHIHSCLSPCGDLDMSPRNIVKTSLEKGLDMIAVTDHNASENIAAVMEAALGSELKVLAGMEVTSEEEAHLLVLFDDMESMGKFQTVVYDNLPDFGLDSATKQNQVIANARDEVEGFNEHFLWGATTLTYQQLVEMAHDLNGLAIASHVDKESYSIIAQLGFIPEELDLDALEISPSRTILQALETFPDTKRFPLVKFSDAHFFKDIGGQTTRFLIDEPTIAELKKALRSEDGRGIEIREK